MAAVCYWLNQLAPTGPPALGTAPAGLAGAVFQHYAHLGETVAGGVGGGPVLVGAGLIALGDQLLDLGHFVVRFIALEEGVRILLQDAEVILLDERQEFFDGSGSIVSQLWIDPERMLILKTERDKLDASGTIIGHKEAMATGFEM